MKFYKAAILIAATFATTLPLTLAAVAVAASEPKHAGIVLNAIDMSGLELNGIRVEMVTVQFHDQPH